MPHPGPPVPAIIRPRARPESPGPPRDRLAEQSLHRFEVLVIDQSRGAATRELVEDRARRDGRFRYLRLDQAGLSRAYNAGVRAAAAETPAFTDDDCGAPPDWPARGKRAFPGRSDGRPPSGPVRDR